MEYKPIKTTRSAEGFKYSKSSSYKPKKYNYSISKSVAKSIKKDYKREERRNRTSLARENRLNRRELVSTGKSFVAILLAVLLLVLLIRVMNGSSIPTFTSFLELLSSAPTVKVPFLSTVGTALGDWGVFNFLRDFIAFFNNIVNVLVFLFNGLANLVVYVVWFVRWLFA